MNHLPTAKQVAEAAGVSADTARRWLSGRGAMPVRAIRDIKRRWPSLDIARLIDMVTSRQESPVDLRSRDCRIMHDCDKPSRPRRRSVRERRGIEIEVE